MAVRSIPFYRETLQLIARLAARRLRDGDVVVDLGTATGRALDTIANHLDPGVGVRLIGIDESRPMLERAVAVPDVELIEHDLRLGLPDQVMELRPRVILCLWTAQFVPIEHRARLYRDCRSAISDGGALFIAEKLRGQTADFEVELRAAYREWKERSGYSVEEIRTKARALEGRLVPNDAPGQKTMLAREGWHVEEIIRYLSFAAWECLPAGPRPPTAVG